MAKFDTRSDTSPVLGLSATLSGTTKASGNWADMQGFESITWTFATGTVTDAGTSAGFSFQIEHSDTTADADAVAVPDGDLIGTEAALTVTSDDDDDKMIGSLGYRGDKRYVRVTATGTTGTNAVVSVHGQKGHGALLGDVVVDAGTAAT